MPRILDRNNGGLSAHGRDEAKRRIKDALDWLIARDGPTSQECKYALEDLRNASDILSRGAINFVAQDARKSLPEARKA